MFEFSDVMYIIMCLVQLVQCFCTLFVSRLLFGASHTSSLIVKLNLTDGALATITQTNRPIDVAIDFLNTRICWGSYESEYNCIPNINANSWIGTLGNYGR